MAKMVDLMLDFNPTDAASLNSDSSFSSLLEFILENPKDIMAAIGIKSFKTIQKVDASGRDELASIHGLFRFV